VALARSSQLRHPSGVTLKTPLLIPAFSSKGSRFTPQGRSEIADALKTSSEFLTDVVLLSAYDIFYGHIPGPNRFALRAELTFVDSGGYETADEHDLSAVFRHLYPARKWNEGFLLRVLKAWPRSFPAVFVSYDHGRTRKPLSQQVAAARRLFAKHPAHLHEFILKPERRAQETIARTVTRLLPRIEMVKGFDLIGVTEKELGVSVLDRMECIARLRLALDQAGMSTPLHIFGALDPIMSSLYFVSGAEVFDGLTWLRYSFIEGRAVYLHDYGALRIGIHERDELVRARSIADNINYLQKLRFQMQAFLLDRDFRKLEYNSGVVEMAYDALQTRLGGKV
jgi:hypothetical protein